MLSEAVAFMLVVMRPAVMHSRLATLNVAQLDYNRLGTDNAYAPSLGVTDSR